MPDMSIQTLIYHKIYLRFRYQTMHVIKKKKIIRISQASIKSTGLFIFEISVEPIEDQRYISYRELKRKANDRESWKLLQINH